jgi:hypothetical protein
MSFDDKRFPELIRELYRTVGEQQPGAAAGLPASPGWLVRRDL